MAVAECAIGAIELSLDAAKEQLATCRSPSGPGVINTAALQLRALAALCNAGEIDVADPHLPLEQRRIFGDATDAAILRFAERLDKGSTAYLRACWKKVYDLAFNSKNKLMIRCFVNTRREALAEVLPDTAMDSFKLGDM